MEFYHEKYNVKWCDKRETEVRVLFLNTDYLFLGQEYWYMDSQHSTAIHISETTNPRGTRKQDNPLKGIRNPIPQEPDNPFKGIQDLIQNGTQSQWLTGLIIPT